MSQKRKTAVMISTRTTPSGLKPTISNNENVFWEVYTLRTSIDPKQTYHQAHRPILAFGHNY
eukprot:5205821-Amphidinium_carterae.1